MWDFIVKVFNFLKKVFIILAILAGLGILTGITFRLMATDLQPTAPLGAGGVLVLIAWGLWAKMRNLDRRNAILAGAPPLPIRLVNVDDDVWIRGQIECDSPIQIPYFSHLAVHYSYSVSEQVTTTRTDSQGKTVTETKWEVRETGGDSTPFRIDDNGYSLWIDPGKATFYDQLGDGYQSGNWRYSCSYTPDEGEASAVGVVDEGKNSLIPKEHVPLIVTLKERAKFLEDAEANEKTVGRFGSVFGVYGFYLLFYGLGRLFDGTQPRSEANISNLGLGIGLGVGVPAILLVWFARVYNTFVILRNRNRETWSQVDVILKQRYDLIPSLVETVKGYMNHEKELLASLSAIRNKAISGDAPIRIGEEKGMVNGIINLFALVENYPQLKASELFLKVGNEITALEEKIAHARATYNNAVLEFNTQIAIVPNNLVAQFFGLNETPMFSAELDALVVPQIKLS